MTISPPALPLRSCSLFETIPHDLFFSAKNLSINTARVFSTATSSAELSQGIYPKVLHALPQQNIGIGRSLNHFTGRSAAGITRIFTKPWLAAAFIGITLYIGYRGYLNLKTSSPLAISCSHFITTKLPSELFYYFSLPKIEAPGVSKNRIQLPSLSNAKKIDFPVPTSPNNSIETPTLYYGEKEDFRIVDPILDHFSFEVSNEGLVHPLTGEPLQSKDITEAFLNNLTKEIRAFYRELIITNVFRYQSGTNRQEILNDLEDEEKKFRTRLSHFRQIVHIFVQRNKNNDLASSISHRITRYFSTFVILLDVVRYLPLTNEEVIETLLNPFSLVSSAIILERVKAKTHRPVHLTINIPDRFRIELMNETNRHFNNEIFHQIAEELILNAIKYCKSEAKAEWITEENTLIVMNDGLEIPSDFNPWLAGSRGNHPDIPGTGYGLSNALSDAKAEGWELSYTSQFGKTIFKLKIK